MLKFLLIAALIIYVISKIGGFFFRAGAASQNRTQNRRPADGNVNVDGNSGKSQKSRKFKGGEYVDYEEVK